MIRKSNLKESKLTSHTLNIYMKRSLLSHLSDQNDVENCRKNSVQKVTKTKQK